MARMTAREREALQQAKQAAAWQAHKAKVKAEFDKQAALDAAAKKKVEDKAAAKEARKQERQNNKASKKTKGQ